MSKKAIVFFSRNGSTRIAAGMLAERLGAELIELKEEKPVRGFLRSGYRAVKKKQPPLADSPWERCLDKDILILGTPVWASSGTPAMNTFLEAADFKGKTVYIFTVQADPGLRNSEAVFKNISQKVAAAGGTVAGTMALEGASPGKTAPPEKLKGIETWDIG